MPRVFPLRPRPPPLLLTSLAGMPRVFPSHSRPPAPPPIPALPSLADHSPSAHTAEASLSTPLPVPAVLEKSALAHKSREQPQPRAAVWIICRVEDANPESHRSVLA